LFADYLQWETWRDEQNGVQSKAPAEAAPQQEPAPGQVSPSRKKLSYMEQREYDAIEARIEDADARLRTAEHRIEVPEVATNPELLTAALAELEQARADHDAIYERWVELTEKIGG
jgi:ATP-binding cassette subfamily F protein uup